MPKKYAFILVAKNSDPQNRKCLLLFFCTEILFSSKTGLLCSNLDGHSHLLWIYYLLVSTWTTELAFWMVIYKKKPSWSMIKNCSILLYSFVSRGITFPTLKCEQQNHLLKVFYCFIKTLSLSLISEWQYEARHDTRMA